VKGIGTVEFNKKDIVRHRLVSRIVEAYEREEDERTSAAIDRTSASLSDRGVDVPQDGKT